MCIHTYRKFIIKIFKCNQLNNAKHHYLTIDSSCVLIQFMSQNSVINSIFISFQIIKGIFICTTIVSKYAKIFIHHIHKTFFPCFLAYDISSDH